MKNKSSYSKTAQQSIQQQSKPKENYQTLSNNNNDSFDLFLADSFEFYLKENISDSKFKKIEQAALMMWGLNVTKCIMSDFGKMQFTMQCVLGEKTANMQSKHITKKLFSVVKNNNDKTSRHETITIHHKNLSEKVLFSYGNKQKKEILDLLQDQQILPSDIPRHVRLAQNVCNAHLRDLIADGLIVRCNTVTTASKNNNNANYHKKDVDMHRYYTCVFSNLTINFVHSKISIQAIVKKEFYKNSVLYMIHPSTKNYGKIQREYDIKDMGENYTKYRKNQDKGKKS